jgi:hypothetical protein
MQSFYTQQEQSLLSPQNRGDLRDSSIKGCSVLLNLRYNRGEKVREFVCPSPPIFSSFFLSTETLLACEVFWKPYDLSLFCHPLQLFFEAKPPP